MNTCSDSDSLASLNQVKYQLLILTPSASGLAWLDILLSAFTWWLVQVNSIISATTTVSKLPWKSLTLWVSEALNSVITLHNHRTNNSGNSSMAFMDWMNLKWSVNCQTSSLILATNRKLLLSLLVAQSHQKLLSKLVELHDNDRYKNETSKMWTDAMRRCCYYAQIITQVTT